MIDINDFSAYDYIDNHQYLIMNEEQASALLRVLGDESRLRILRLLLIRGETCACRFLEDVKCGQATLSHHLAMLARVGLVIVRKDGTRRLYRVNHELYSTLLRYIAK